MAVHLGLIGALEALAVGVVASIVVREVTAPKSPAVPQLPPPADPKALPPAKVSGLEGEDNAEGCIPCAGLAGDDVGCPSVSDDELSGAGTWIDAKTSDAARDGVVPRYRELLKEALGFEVREEHNGNLWRFRVVSAKTDPNFTIHPKDVRGWLWQCAAAPAAAPAAPAPHAAAPAAAPAPHAAAPAEAPGVDMEIDLDATGFAVPYRITGSRWSVPIRAVDKGGVPGRLTLSPWSVPAHFVTEGGIPVHNADAPAASSTPSSSTATASSSTPSPAPAAPPAAKVSGWGDQLFEGLKVAGQGAASVFLGPEAGKAVGTLASTVKSTADKETGHEPNEGRYPVSALPGLGPAAPAAPAAPVTVAAPAGAAPASPAPRVVPEGATTGGGKQVMCAGRWIPLITNRRPTNVQGAAMRDPNLEGVDDLGAALPGRPMPAAFGATRKGNKWSWPGTAAGNANFERWKAADATWRAKNTRYQAAIQARKLSRRQAILQRRLAWQTGLLQQLQQGQQPDAATFDDPDAVDPMADDSDAFGGDDDMSGAPGPSVEGAELEGIDPGNIAGLADGLGLTDVQRRRLAENAARRQHHTPGHTAPAHGHTAPHHGHTAPHHGAEELAHLHAELLVAKHHEHKDAQHIEHLEHGLHALAHVLGQGAHVLDEQNRRMSARIVAASGNLQGADLQGADLVDGADDLGRHHAHQAAGHKTIAMLRHEIAQAHAKGHHDHELIQHLEHGAHALEHALHQAERYFEHKNTRLVAAIEATRRGDGTGKAPEGDDLGRHHHGGGYGGGYGRRSPYSPAGYGNVYAGYQAQPYQYGPPMPPIDDDAYQSPFADLAGKEKEKPGKDDVGAVGKIDCAGSCAPTKPGTGAYVPAFSTKGSRDDGLN